MRGTVVSVDRQARGSVLVTAITSPSTTLEVLSAADFPSSGQVLVAGHTLTYTEVKWKAIKADGVTKDTLVLSGTAGFSAPKNTTRVDVPGSVEYVAQVQPSHSTGLLSAVIDHHLISDVSLKRAAVSDGALVELEDRGGRWYVARIIKREPSLDLSNAVDGSLHVATIDPDEFESAVIGIAVGGGGALFAYFDGGLDGAPAYTFTDGGLFS